MGEKERKKGRSIVTRTGDEGETSLLYGQRVSKSHPQVEACGALDELSASLAMVKATCPPGTRQEAFEKMQQDLIALMGEISTSADEVERYRQSSLPRIEEANLDLLERMVAELEGASESGFQGWALPGKNLHEASLEVARATARRAERRLVALKENGFPLHPLLLRYLNRLSDLLWLLAREAE
jgi:cob(I)alamin adenosyltransferase